MKPRFMGKDKIAFVLTAKTERSFLFRRDVYRVVWEDGFQFLDRDGELWRPTKRQYDSDGASVPHPLDWLIPALQPFRYRYAAMGIHDPAYRHGALERWFPHEGRWRVVRVPKSIADDLLAQGVEASGGWRATACTYKFFTGMGHLWR